MIPHHHLASTPCDRARTQAGTALVGTATGVAVFIVLLLFAVQLLVNLYATTVVTAAGLDAARLAAAKDVDHTDAGAVAAARARGEARFRSLVGEAGERAVLTWADDADTVRLSVAIETPTILPRSLGGVVAFGRIERTFVVRVEELR